MATDHPFLSICIPVFNQDIRILASRLLAQKALLSAAVEILIAEDGSTGRIQQENSRFLEDKEVKYFPEKENKGRSAIRNFLADKSSGEYLLFIDGDSAVEKTDFLSDYLDELKKHTGTVICGGTKFPECLPDDGCRLHYMYGTKVIQRLHSKQDKAGNIHFMASNFAIPAGIFHRIRFDEGLKEYGHEDTIFGFLLTSLNIPIISIDNPVIHEGLDENNLFLKKTFQAVDNLGRLIDDKTYGPYVRNISLVRIAARLRQWKADRLYTLFFGIAKSMVLRQLKSEKPSLILFQAYKLYLLLKSQQ